MLVSELRPQDSARYEKVALLSESALKGLLRGCFSGHNSVPQSISDAVAEQSLASPGAQGRGVGKEATLNPNKLAVIEISPRLNAEVDVIPKLALGMQTEATQSLLSLHLKKGSKCKLSLEFWSLESTELTLVVRSAAGKIRTLTREGSIGTEFFDLEIASEAEVEIHLEAIARTGSDAFFLGGTLAQKSSIFSSARLAKSKSLLYTRVATNGLKSPTGEPLTQEDIENFFKIRNVHEGKRIFVVGNGPSLNDLPLENLAGEFTFGLNRISLLFDRISWRPTFFTAFDTAVVPDNVEEFRETSADRKFFSARYKTFFSGTANCLWHHVKGFYRGFEASFAPLAPFVGFGGGGTIAVIAVELAAFMGFREIYLIGMDLNWTIPSTVTQTGAHMPDGTRLKFESQFDDDPNHFDPRYFGKGKKWHSPNALDMKIGLSRAHKYCEERGILLRNASRGGDLNQVPRVDFDQLFEGAIS